MMRCAALLAAAGAMLAAAAPAAAQDRKAEIRHIVFELCPKIMDGTISLSDPAQAAAIGFTPTAPRETPGGQIPRAEKGTGPAKIVLAGMLDSCTAWFGGPDNPDLAGSVVEQANKAGFKGSNRPISLGDGTLLFSFRDKQDAARSLVILMADAGGELDVQPATTVVMMKTKGN